jgi:hypothetical protein
MGIGQNNGEILLIFHIDNKKLQLHMMRMQYAGEYHCDIIRLGFTCYIHSVAEPELELEPVERQLLAGAGTKYFLARIRLRSMLCYVNSYKMLQKP